MSQKEIEKMVKEYIKKVKEKLPDWLKNKKSELKDTLSEIEEHLWDKSEELSGIGAATEDSVRMAIAHMGTPQSIAKEYKKRGTPKVYITEELWPLYTKVLGILCAVIIVINVVAIILNLIFGSWENIEMSGLLLGIAGVFTIVTIIFVALSMEGYLPEDFKSEADRKREHKELEKAEQKGWSISKKSGKPLKPFMSPTGMIIGGIVQMAMGLVFIMLPNIGIISITSLMNPKFILILSLFGVFILMEGTIDLVRGVVGKQQITANQVLMTIKIAISLASISLIAFVMNNPGIISIIYWTEETGLNVLEISKSVQELISMGLAWIIFFVIIGAVFDLGKAISLNKYKNVN